LLYHSITKGYFIEWIPAGSEAVTLPQWEDSSEEEDHANTTQAVAYPGGGGRRHTPVTGL
jgi:hypothetical protein